MATEIDAARLLTWRRRHEGRGGDDILAAAEAKLFASDVAVKASRDCVQIFGGYGSERLPRGAPLPRREDHGDLRGDQRDHEAVIRRDLKE